MHTLVFLDPAHFHGALTLRTQHPLVRDEVFVYAPPGPDLDDFVALVQAFNRRSSAPTRWRVTVRAGDRSLERLLDDRPGDIVVLAGRNDRKMALARRLHDAGLHVLADKPWMTTPDALADVRHVLSGGAAGPVTMEIMTGRHEVTSLLVDRLVREADVFGGFDTERSPAITLDGVHYLEKTVNGVPLRRPPWYFDVRVQGNGLADIPTHLVDQVQRLLSAHGDPSARTLELRDARLSATRVPRDLFARVTGLDDFPAELGAAVAGDRLDYEGNGSLAFRACGVDVEAATRWELSTPAGGGDTHRSVIRGRTASIRVEQGPETGYRRRIFLEPRRDAASVRAALTSALAAWQPEFPGVTVSAAPDATPGPRDRNGGRPARNDANDHALELVIPDTLRTGHESHFPLVLDELLRSVARGRWPDERAAVTLAKYELLAAALAAARIERATRP